MAFTREDLVAYEKQPQKQVDDKVNPFRGATPAKAADAASIAAVASGQVDATPGGNAAAAASDPLVDDNAPVVDEDGTLGDPTDSGEGTSDENADPSTASADLSGESDPNADLTGEEGEEEPTARPAPKKGSAEERIVELNDLTEGYKVFGKQMQDQLKSALAENERLRAGGKPTPEQVAAARAPHEIKDEPMPDMSDADIAFDNDKYRVKLQKWTQDQIKIGTRAAVREMTGADDAAKRRADVEAKIEKFAKTHPDYEDVVTKNVTLASNQLGIDAGALVAQSEHTGRLLYKFGKDTALAVRTARQSPAQQCATIGQMIAEIENEDRVNAAKAKQNGNGSRPAAQAGQKKSITQAPPPPRPTTGGGRATPRDIVDPNMSMDEFARRHRGDKQSARDNFRKLRGLT